MSSPTGPDERVSSFHINIPDNAVPTDDRTVDHPNQQSPIEEADDPPISLPSTWKRGNVSFRSDTGDPIPKFEFSPKSYLIIPGDELKSSIDENVKLLINFLQRSPPELSSDLPSMMTASNSSSTSFHREDVGGWSLEIPKILINMVGDTQHSHVSPELLKSVIKSLFRMTKNTWIFSDGYGTELNRIVGHGVKEISQKCNLIKNEECNVRVTSLGFVAWDKINGKEMVEKGEDYDFRIVKHDTRNHKYALDKNNTHFIGVEGPGYSPMTLKQTLFREIQVPGANLLIGGGKLTFKFVAQSLGENIPCIVIAGSGGLANLLVPLVRLLQDSATPVNDEVINTISAQAQKIKGVGIDPKSNEFRQCLKKYEYITICDPDNFNKAEIQERLLEGYLTFIKDTKVKDRLSITIDNDTDNYRINFLKLCQSWNCPGIATKALTSFEDLNNLELLDCLMSFLEAGNATFVKLLVSSKPSTINELGRKHFHDLYISDKIILRIARQLYKSEVADISGIHQVGEDIKSLIEDVVSKQLPRHFDRQFHLFLWAIIFKKYELAQFFWNMSDFPIANGLIASSIVRTVIKSGSTNEEENEILVEVANRYEEKASTLLTKCHDRSPMRTKFLLLRDMCDRGHMSCLQLATKDDENANFLAMCNRHMDDIWLKCCRGDGSCLLVNLVASAFFFSFLLFFLLAILVDCMKLISAAIAISSLILFIIQVGFMQATKRFRISYNRIRPVVEAEEKADLEKLEGVTKDEVNLFLKYGIPMDLIQQNQKENLENKNHFLFEIFSHLYHFLDTPQVKFNLHVFSFIIYLFLFAFFILSAPPNLASILPSSTELKLYLYIFAVNVHEMKQFLTGDVKKQETETETEMEKECFWRKIKEHMYSMWNQMDFGLFIYFIIILSCRLGFYLRTSPKVASPPETRYLLNLYSLFFVLWCLRLLQLFAVSKTLGPKLIMIRLMTHDLMKMLLYIIIFAFAYAVWHMVSMKTLTKEFLIGDDRNSTMSSPLNFLLEVNITDVFYFMDDMWESPFWHLFGEGFLDGYDQYLPNKSHTNAYGYQYRVFMIKFGAPLVRLIYMCITVVLLLNLMIAIFQYSITAVQEKANRNWNIYRKGVIFEYHNRAILPVPLSFICDIPFILKFLFKSKSCLNDWPFNIMPESERFKCSTLRFCVTGMKDGTNPFYSWLEFIRKWEKLLQKHHLINDTQASAIVASNAQYVSQRQTSEATRIMQVKEELEKLKLENKKILGKIDALKADTLSASSHALAMKEIMGKIDALKANTL